MSKKIYIPDGWEVKKLGEVCESIVRGPFGSALKKEYFIEYNINAYKVYEQKNAIQENCKLGNYFISKEKFETLKRFECKPNDIIMSCSGTIGKLYTIPTNAHRGIINQALLKITLNKNIIGYIFKLFFAMEISKLTLAGSGIQNISSVKYLKNIPILIPPLVEQKKIAEILSLWDKSIEHIKKLIAYKEKYKKGLMQNLLTGKKRLNGFNDEWKTYKLGEVVEILDSQRIPISREKRTSGIYPYYGANGIVDYINDYIFDGEFLLVGEDGSVINDDKSPVLIWATGKIWVNNHAHVLCEKSCIKLHFLYFYMQTINVSSFVRGLPPKLNQTNLINISVTIPPLDEQKAIADILSSADKEIELLKKQLNLYTEQKKGLMQNLLTGKVRV